MRRQLTIALLLATFAWAGCGSDKSPTQTTRQDGHVQPDIPDQTPPDTGVPMDLGTQDAGSRDLPPGCDLDAMSEHLFIINCNPGPGATPVYRINPPSYATCRLL